MKRKRSNTHRHCHHCGKKFEVNPRIGSRHRHCAAPQCRRIAKRKSQERWLSKPENAGYFRGAANALRSRLWRAANPKRRPRGQRMAERLLSKELHAALKACGVQEMNDRQLALMLGVVSLLARSCAQESIAAKIRKLMLAGYAVLRDAAPTPEARRSSCPQPRP